MKKTTLTLFAFLLMSAAAIAQGEQNRWAFSYKAGLDFSSGTPVFSGNQLYPGDGCSASICNASGQMLFYTNGFWVWNRDNEILPELTGGISGYTSVISPSVGYPPMMPWDGTYGTQSTAIAAAPNQTGKYYLFSLGTSGTLFYSMIDMSLNGGKGGIIAGKKGVYMASGLTEKLTVVKGCNNIWVVTRAKNTNQFRSFEINDTGILTSPVISNCGNLPIGWYRQGVIKFSPDGTKMASACNLELNKKGGLELYDFNPQTGILSNPIVLDSSSTLGYYYGACFSPDNSKLYATTSSFADAGIFYAGKVHQFNINLATPASIAASNTVVFTDAVYELNRLGDLKRGNNGKIYFSSGEPTYSTLHCINSPNTTGTGCNAVANVIPMPVGTASRGMPNDIAFIAPPDSVHIVKQITACFRDSAIIIADTGKHYKWDNGSTNRERKITANGIYTVSFINLDCKYETDSIYVHFIKLPILSPPGYSCPNAKQGVASIKPNAGDTTTFLFKWKDGLGNTMQQHWSNHGDTITGMDTGLHFVQILTPSGCDTTLSVIVLPLPLPRASFDMDTLGCKGAFLNITIDSTAPLQQWYFGDGNYSNQLNPSYAYGQTGIYTVTLAVTNIEGCSDTMQKNVDVKGLELNLTADKELVNRGDVIHLQSSGSESYSVTGWKPGFLFPDQTATMQILTLDTTRTFFVTGVSALGCVAEASVTVSVNPKVFMANAFSPNGDGLNDRFRPISSGYIFVRFFEVYNRYGQQVYKAEGLKALEGWDGIFNGKEEELGTYFYHINVETREGQTIALKGDVILLR